METLEKILTQHSYSGLSDGFYSHQLQQPLNDPYLIHANDALLKELGLSSCDKNKLMHLFNGDIHISNIQPFSMSYAGHQFGQYVQQLGDGRGVMLGELENNGCGLDIHIKGCGKTPYSRFGDGRAVLRSSIREYLCGEAMTGLGIASSRSLMIFGSNDLAYREKSESTAMIARTARTHIRFGNFEKFFYDQQYEKHKELCDYVIPKYFKDAHQYKNKYEYLLKSIIENTANMIACWQAVGFCHGVMNTDNMSILGETIDYGPYGFLDDYNPSHICNLSDNLGRYSYENQPYIGLWNCSALAKTFERLVDKKFIEEIGNLYEETYSNKLISLFKKKLGLFEENPDDKLLIQELLDLMQENTLDYTRTFRSLSNAIIKNHEIEINTSIKKWSDKFSKRHLIEKTDVKTRINIMHQHNPKFILRNYMTQVAIENAEEGSYKEIQRLMKILKNPFEENLEYSKYAENSPAWAKDIGLSCSS
jgi:uncharacterized protein YdiU (UPF0061 family)